MQEKHFSKVQNTYTYQIFLFTVISDANSEYVFIIGAAAVTLSIHALQYIGGPLLNLTVKGETNKRHRNLSILSAFAFNVFLIIGECTPEFHTRTTHHSKIIEEE